MSLRLLCFLIATSPLVALTIDSPRDWQVFQRVTKETGSIKLSGTANAEVRCRINGDWQTIAVDANTHRFEAAIPCPAGGWYQLELESGADKAMIEHVGIGEVFIVAGQSNAANHGSEKQVTQTQRVASFDGRDWHLANDPQLGATGSNGSFMPAFGDAMVKAFDVPIGIIPVAAGGTSVREWLPKGIRFKQNTTTGHGVTAVGDEFESNGTLFDKLTKPMKALGIAGFRAVIWHQGESDAGQAREGHPADRQISGAQYVELMEQLIRRSRNAAAWPVPWFTAITTYHREEDAPDDEFRSAMQSLWSKGLSWPGPDTDQLRAGFRAGVHFNGKGLEKHGELWAQSLGPWLTNMLSAPHDGPPDKDYKLVWQDEFDGQALDDKKWAHRSVGERRGAWIDPECVSFDGQGHMLISVKKVGDQYHGGMIGTEKKASWTHGYFECRVQVATELGMNTAFWIQAPRMSAPDKGQGIADDTAHNGTEIDILEYIARQGDVAHFNLHWNGYGKLHKSAPADGWLHDLRNGFHVYGVEWTSSGYDFFIDGRRYWHTSEAISNTDEYIILDLEVSQWAGGIEKAKLPTSAVFDWVRVWQKQP
jgi:hypothetical protein